MPRSAPKPIKARSKPKATVAQIGSQFLELALELRENIYGHLLYDHPSALFDLLTVNRQLAREVKPFLYRQPLTFDGQSELFCWLSEVDHKYLSHVVDVRFKLHDIDPAKIVGALGRRLQQAIISRKSGSRGPDTEDNPYFEACHLDLKRVLCAFQLLPNVRNFTILSSSEGDPEPHYRTMDAFSKLLGNCFPNLCSLTSEEDQFPTDCLASKPKLRRLRFPATTTTDDNETANIFRNLALRELEICRLPHHTASGAEEYGCLTPVLYTLPPLHSLTIFEAGGAETPNLVREIFAGYDRSANPAMRKHLCSLRTLKLLAEPGPAYSPMNIATTFLGSSYLSHIEYLDSWASLYDRLPSTIQTVVWRINWYPSASIESLVDRIKHLVTRAIRAHEGPIGHRLTNLNKISMSLSPVCVEQESEDSESTPEDVLIAASKRLGMLGIKFTWKVQEWHEIF